DHNYDLRHLERTVLASRTYQRSSVPNESNKFDKNNFARGYVRPMMAEVVVDVLDAALGVEEQWGNEAPKGRKMVEVGASRLNNSNLGYALRIFGRPKIRRAYPRLELFSRLAPTSTIFRPLGASLPHCSSTPSAASSTSTTTSAIIGRTYPRAKLFLSNLFDSFGTDDRWYVRDARTVRSRWRRS